MSALFMFICGIIPPSVTSQKPVFGPEVTLNKISVPALQHGEQKCDYFPWTTLGTSVQRVGFNYTDSDGKTTGDTPPIENITILIDPGKTVPTAQLSDEKDAGGHPKWRLRMSPGTHESNQACLQGVAVVKDPAAAQAAQ
jgi:hypothetical protein